MPKAEKKKTQEKSKAKKLKVNKKTIKDLELDDPSSVKGGLGGVIGGTNTGRPTCYIRYC
jgi:hypothetical protein